MRLRKILVKVFYYYMLLSVTVSVFIFGSVFTTQLNQFHNNKGINKDAFSFWFFLLVYFVLGLYAIIVFRRRQEDLNNRVFGFIFILLVGTFAFPFLLVLIDLMLFGTAVN